MALLFIYGLFSILLTGIFVIFFLDVTAGETNCLLTTENTYFYSVQNQMIVSNNFTTCTLSYIVHGV